MTAGAPEYAYGLTAAATRRHIVWSEVLGKCGQRLVARSVDTTIPVCEQCVRAMARLARDQPHRLRTDRLADPGTPRHQAAVAVGTDEEEAQ